MWRRRQCRHRPRRRGGTQKHCSREVEVHYRGGGRSRTPHPPQAAVASAANEERSNLLQTTEARVGDELRSDERRMGTPPARSLARSAARSFVRIGRMEDRQTHSGRRKGGGRKGPTKPRGEGRVDDGNNSRGRNGAEGGRRPLHGTRSKCRAGGWGRSVGRRKRRDSIRSSSSSSSSSRLNLRNDVRHRQSAEQEEEEAR